MRCIFLIHVLLIGRSYAEISNQSFPEGFMFGVSTAAYQIEGAWNVDGKGESIWDRYVHQKPSVIADNETGDVTCDSYHKFKEDVSLIAGMGLTHYRFSLSWTRILPTGFNNKVNDAGIQYYKKLLQELAASNIIPLVTIYHWDLPQTIQDLGGWLNPNIVDYFKDYAKVVFDNFEEVTYWITINEPKQVCTGGYGKASMAPGISLNGIADYICAYNLLKAHAAVYHMYKEDLNKTGMITIAIDGSWSEPASDSQEDKDAAERRRQFEFGLYAHPVFKGGWPEIVSSRVEERSKQENFQSSRLPKLTDDEIAYINETADFMAVNFYEAALVSDVEEGDYESPSFPKDVKVNTTKDPSWPLGYGGNAIVPWAFRRFLAWIKENYDDPHIMITENGVGDDGSSFYDGQRIYFIADYLSSLLEAIHEDKVDVFGYTFWSLMDNFEWRNGFTTRFGLYSVNFSDPDRPRTAKASVDFFKDIAGTLKIPNMTDFTTIPPASSPDTTGAPTASTKKPGGGGAVTINHNIYLFIVSLTGLLKCVY